MPENRKEFSQQYQLNLRPVVVIIGNYIEWAKQTNQKNNENNGK